MVVPQDALGKLLFDSYKDPLNAVGHQEHQQNGHTGGAVIIALQAVGDHIADAAGTHHTQDGTLGEVGLQAHPCPGHDLGQGGGQDGIAEDTQPARAGDLQGLDGLIRDALKALGKGFG